MDGVLKQCNRLASDTRTRVLGVRELMTPIEGLKEFRKMGMAGKTLIVYRPKRLLTLRRCLLPRGRVPFPVKKTPSAMTVRTIGEMIGCVGLKGS